MSEPLCPNCHAELAIEENDICCDKCGQPLRCPFCNNTSFSIGASFCKKCRKPVSEWASSLQPASSENHIQIIEAGRRIDVRASDESMAHSREWMPYIFNQGEAPLVSIAPDMIPTSRQLPPVITQAAPSLSTEYDAGQGLWETMGEGEDQVSQKPHMRRKRHSGSEQHPASKGTKRSPQKRTVLPPDSDALVEKWVSHEETKTLTGLIPHRTLSSWTALDQSILGLYGIYKAGMEQEVAYSLIIDYLYRAFRVKVEAKNMQPALSKASKDKKHYINYLDGRGYSITPSGCDYIEEKLKGKEQAG